MKFTIIVVALNPGEKLNRTLDSVLCQTYRDYEVIVKDGGSKDGSIEGMRQDERIRLFAEPDKGIYDAMNQAVSHASGDYVLFLNCGDVLYGESVLEQVAERIVSVEAGDGRTAAVETEGGAGRTAAAETEDGAGRADTIGACPTIFYGDTYGSKNDVLISAPPMIDGFACYRNIPCHQSCFYAVRLCREKPYEQGYRIRADYDHFLWCYYRAKAQMVYLGLTVAAYEGGGYSESKENRRRDQAEHREITKRYMSRGELFRYRAVMALTLAPLRSFLAESKWFSGVYHKIKSRLYR